MRNKRKAIKKEVRYQVWEKYGKKCAYCGCDLEYKEMQVDHILAVTRKIKESHEFKDHNDIENLNPSCRGCNYYKDTFTIEQFRSVMLTLHERVSKPFIFRLAQKYKMVEIKPFDGKFYFEKTSKTF